MKKHPARVDMSTAPCNFTLTRFFKPDWTQSGEDPESDQARKGDNEKPVAHRSETVISPRHGLGDPHVLESKCAPKMGVAFSPTKSSIQHCERTCCHVSHARRRLDQFDVGVVDVDVILPRAPQQQPSEAVRESSIPSAHHNPVKRGNAIPFFRPPQKI